MRRFFLLILMVLVVMCCYGCADSIEKPNVAAQKETYVVQDARGKKLRFETKPQRIVSLYIYGDEVLLGLVDHKRIAGLSKWVHDKDLSMATEEAKDVKQIVANTPESVLALKPDLVLLPSSTKAEQISALEDIGVKVFVYPAASRLSNIPDTIRIIGAAVGERKQAEKLIAEMQQRIGAVEAKTKEIAPNARKRSLLYLRLGVIGGKGMIFNDILTAAGVEDCYDSGRSNYLNQDGKSRILSKEEVVQANPDYFIVGTWSMGGADKAGKALLEEIYSDPALATVTAVRKKQGIIIPSGYVNCLSQHAADAIELLHEAVYGK